MSENPNPYMNMTKEELMAACVDDCEEDQAIELAEEWLRILTLQPESSISTRRRAYIHRSRERHDCLFNDYFAANPVYTDAQLYPGSCEIAEDWLEDAALLQKKIRCSIIFNCRRRHLEGDGNEAEEFH
ncbi:hypothetical protein Dimus_033672 [Dionaea muscipula]